MYIIWLRLKVWIKSFRKQEENYEIYVYEEDEDK